MLFIAVPISAAALESDFGETREENSTSASLYAYSIGVNHGFVWPWQNHLEGDFRDNVNYANTCYGMIPRITNSYYTHTPTVTYMRGNNPNGQRRIASEIVFLNGHANWDNLVFNHGNNGGEYATGVYINSDFNSDSGYKYAGLNSTTMNTCDLISFVGCKTAANENTNLTNRAVTRGARSAVGFTDNITSRSSAGKNWLKKYNDALATGSTISASITYATTQYPSSNLGSHVRVYGSSSNTVRSSSINPLNDSLDNRAVNIDIYVPNDIRADSNTKMFKSIESEIKKLDSTFSFDDYRMTINMFGEEDGDGMIVYKYYVDGKIMTNKAFVVSIEGNKVVSITKSPVDNSSNSRTVDEKELLNKVIAHENSRPSINKIVTKNMPIDGIEEYYYYDYNDNELYYFVSTFYINEKINNVIVDDFVETRLK